jgi:hypothetical protein
MQAGTAVRRSPLSISTQEEMVAAKPKLDRRLSGLAFLAGLAVAAVLVLGWRMPPGSSALGLELRLIVNSTGELGVAPAGEIAARARLQPRTSHDRLDGRTTVTNQTARGLLVSVRARPSSRDLDDRLTVTVSVGDRRLFRGPLGQLRSPTRRSALLAAGSSVPLTVSARLPAHVRSGYEARIEDLTLELRAKPRGLG